MTAEPVTFRRAGVDRFTKKVFIVVGRLTYVLKGDYDPDKMLARVVERRFVFLTNWSRI